MNSFSKRLIFTAIYLLSFSGNTWSVASHDNNSFLNLPPRLSLWATSGTGTFGEGDTMIPIWGNANQFFYTDVSGKAGDDNAWLASIGIGGRKIIADQTIWGGYLFYDGDNTPHDKYYNVLNPGIEFMTNEWDGRLNGYLPVGRKSQVVNTFSGLEAGLPNTLFFSGHAEYDTLFSMRENIGAGGDIQVGRTLTDMNRIRIFGGGYYFSPKNTPNITGGGVGIEIPLKNQWAFLELRDNYDNHYQNSVGLTLRLTFGGLNKKGKPDIHDRMLDIIPRHFSQLQTGDSIPSETARAKSGSVLLKNNIWFFNPYGSGDTPVTSWESCTFEHPCNGLTQSQIDAINNLSMNANFYLSPGTYNNPAVGNGYSFYNGQNVYGRTYNYLSPAIGTLRPLINDSIFLNGNNTISDLRINAQTNIIPPIAAQLFQTGIYIPSTAIGVMNIWNTDISSFSSLNSVAGSFSASNSAIVNFNNVNVNTGGSDVDGQVLIGLANIGTGTMNINNSSISVSSINAVNSNRTVLDVANNAGTLNVINSRLSAVLNNATASVNNDTVAGVISLSQFPSPQPITNIVNSSIFISMNGQNNSGFGILNLGEVAPGVVNLSQTTITGVLSNANGSLLIGAAAMSQGIINLNQSIINLSGDSGSLIGLATFSPISTINFQNTVIALNTSGTALGFSTFSFGGGPINNNGGNQCIQNGTLVSC